MTTQPSPHSRLLSAWYAARVAIHMARDLGAIPPVDARAELRAMMDIVSFGIPSEKLEEVARDFRRKAYRYHKVVQGETPLVIDGEEVTAETVAPTPYRPVKSKPDSNIWMFPHETFQNAVKRLYTEGVKQVAIARHFRVSQAYISYIVNGKA